MPDLNRPPQMATVPDFSRSLKPEQPSRRGLATLAATCMTAILLLQPVAEAKQKPAVAAPEIAEKQADLGELRSRIENLRKDLNTNEGNKADAADRLRESERQISRLQRDLHNLGIQRSQLQNRLSALDNQQKALAATLNQQQKQLEQLLYKQYLRGSPDALQMMLNGDNPNQMSRDLYYLSAVALSRAELMGEINATLDTKKRLAADIKERSSELADVEAKQQQQQAELEKQREERKALYADISEKVKAQRREIGNLQRDEKRLSDLINRLSKILAAQAAQAAKEAAARAAAASRAANARPGPSKPTQEAQAEPPSRSSGEENRYEPVPNNGSFLRLKGKLRLPSRGTVSGRFGTSRDGGGTWHGIFIKADTGSSVKAIASGRVVFADWMRGFGNLLIIDHGDDYLSIYGNNDSLLKQVGQAVQGGETVASVGNTGGNPESGLYFEIRHKGQPIDPLKWASLK